VKILITGAGGQIARSLLACPPDGMAIVALSRGELDITDEHSVETTVAHHAPDVIINGAAYTAVDHAESELEAATRINTEGPRNLASAARKCGARLLHISTDFVFDGKSSTPYTPDSPTHPINVYGVTKRAGEEHVLRLLPERSVVLRTAWIYAHQGRNFLLTMLRLMAANRSVRVVADQVGTPTAAHSVATVLWKLVQHPAYTGIHHWTDAGVASWYDFAVAIAEEGAERKLVPPNVAVIPIRGREYPTPARRPAYSVLDKHSLSALGVGPLHWRASLRSVLGELSHA
jgi:dTDP-4-dehydrorhamnose reductase